MSVHPSTWRNSAVTAEWNFMQFDNSARNKNMWWNIQIHDRLVPDISLIMYQHVAVKGFSISALPDISPRRILLFNSNTDVTCDPNITCDDNRENICESFKADTNEMTGTWLLGEIFL